MFKYEDLIQTELVVYEYTSERLNGFYNTFPDIISLSFILQESFGDLDNEDTPKGLLQSIAYMHYVQLSYSLKSIYDLIMKGYYLESQILVRHLFETLVQLKYFNLKPEKLSVHMSKNILLKDMMNAITDKNLYRIYRHLCTYAHGFIMKDIHRTDRSENKTYLGNFYNEDNCTVPINYISVMMIGFIKTYELIFNNNTLISIEASIKLKEDILSWCEHGRETHIKINVDSKNFYHDISDLVC